MNSAVAEGSLRGSEELLAGMPWPRASTKAWTLLFQRAAGAQVVLFEEFALLVGEVPALHAALGERLAAVGGAAEAVGGSGDALMPAVEHQAGDFFDAELRGEVLRAGERRLAPVFIDVQRAVAVQVLEGVAVDLEDGGGSDAERRAAALGDEPITVGLGLLPLRAAGGQQGQGEKQE